MKNYILLLIFMSMHLVAMDEVTIENESTEYKVRYNQTQEGPNVTSVISRRKVHAQRRAGIINRQADEMCCGIKKSKLCYLMTFNCACAAIVLWIYVHLRNEI